MTDEENVPDGFASLFQPWIVQLRTITEGLAGMTGLSESILAPVPSLQGRRSPAPFPRRSCTLIAGGVAAQRSSIAALQAQLAVFDEQLPALEEIIGPLAEWSRTWADFERLVMKARRDPRPED